MSFCDIDIFNTHAKCFLVKLFERISKEYSWYRSVKNKILIFKRTQKETLVHFQYQFVNVT